MNIFAKSEPWTEADWWQAGHLDALECRAARYDGSDVCEDVLRAYIGGYSNGREIMQRTTPCDRLSPTESFEAEETTHYYPGLIPEQYRFACLLLYYFFAIAGFGMIIALAIHWMEALL